MENIDQVRLLAPSALQLVLMSRLRDRTTGRESFCAAALHLGRMLAQQSVGELHRTTIYPHSTPLEDTMGYEFVDPAALVPILRAGRALEVPFRELLPAARTWDLRLSRDHVTLLPSMVSCDVPEQIPWREDAERVCFVLDPMLATGGSADYAIRLLKERGAKRVVFIGIVGAPEGIAFLRERHPDVPIHLAQLDRCLNKNGYILPGLGDFGDRWTGEVP